MTRTLLLALHITGVAAWLGANFVQLVLSPRFDRTSREASLAWVRQTIWLGQRYYNVAGAVIGITGVLLVLDGDWSWGAGFVWVGIGVLVVGGALGGAFFGPTAERRASALEAGDDRAASDALRRIIPVAIVDTALVLLAVLAMVDKWQA